MRSVARTPRVWVLPVVFAWLVCGRPASAQQQAPEFDSVSMGFIATGGFESSLVGYDLTAQAGGQSIGLRSFGGRRWLLQWDAVLAVEAGILGNEFPPPSFFGGHEHGDAEIGYRFLPSAWSPYLGVRLNTDVILNTEPGVPLAKLYTLNDGDGVTGLVANGAARVAFGASYLDGSRSLLLVGFFQEALRGPETFEPAADFTEGGFAGRFDIAQRWTVSLEGFGGRMPVTTSSTYHFTDQATYEELDAGVRWTRKDGMWFGGNFTLSRELNVIAYTGALTYDTANAPTFAFLFLYGFPLGRQE